MRRTPLSKKNARALNSPAFWMGVLVQVLLLASGTAQACTAAAENHADLVHPAPDARPEVRLSMAPAEGLKMRTKHHDTVLSAYLQAAPVSTQLGPKMPGIDRSGRNPAQADRALPHLDPPAPEPSTGQAYKPLAMLAAALALMVSIALRRSGKR